MRYLSMTLFNLIKAWSDYNIHSKIKNERANIQLFLILSKNFWSFSKFFQTVLLGHFLPFRFIGKANEICRNFIISEKMSFQPKKFLKRSKTKYCFNKSKCSNFLERLNFPTSQHNSQLSIGTWGAWNEWLSKVSLLISANLNSDFKPITFETDQRKFYPLWDCFGKSSKSIHNILK